MWWNRKEESSSNGYSSTDERSDEEDDQDEHDETTSSGGAGHSRSLASSISNTFRSGNLSSKKATGAGRSGGGVLGSNSRHSFLGGGNSGDGFGCGGSKSLVPQLRSRRNPQFYQKKQRSKSSRETTTNGRSSSSGAALHHSDHDHNLENAVAETYMGFEVSLTSLTASFDNNNNFFHTSSSNASPTTPKSSSFAAAAAASPSSSSHSQTCFRPFSNMRHHQNNQHGGGAGFMLPSNFPQSSTGGSTTSQNFASPTSNSSQRGGGPATATKVGGSKHTTSHFRGVQMKPVISFQEELKARQKIHRTQYTVAPWPALRPITNNNNIRPKLPGNSTHSSPSRQSQLQNNNRGNKPMIKMSRNHRVQYEGGNTAASRAASSALATEPAGFSFDDCLFLLRSHEVVDEMSSLKEELSQMDAEIDALYKDKIQLEDVISGALNTMTSQQLQQQQSQQQVPPAASIASASSSSALPPQPLELMAAANIPTAWDVNELLGSRNITVAQRSQLQVQRGINLTVHFHDRNATEALASKCGIKNHFLAKFRESHKQLQAHRNQQQQQQSNSLLRNKKNNTVLDSGPLSFVNNQLLLELTADTCRDGGAATHIQQIALLCKDGGRELSFFLGRDQGKSVYWGHLPDRLFRRMQDQGMNPKQSASELSYLATGPMDYYYAEFRSGEAWWGSAVDDRAFHSICTEWDVYRVAFGPCLVVEDDPQQPENIGVASSGSSMGQQQQQRQHPTATSSWVILSRDGRAAWKNIPSRLDRLLQSRMANEAGVAEVSLGCGDSYFCRFLDGTVDYCLPSTVAAVCQQLEEKGSTTITSIALHPELSHDFVIRSSTIY